MTRTGTESNPELFDPDRDDDRVSFRIKARQVNTVLHVVPLVNLVLLSNAAGGASRPSVRTPSPPPVCRSNPSPTWDPATCSRWS